MRWIPVEDNETGGNCLMTTSMSPLVMQRPALFKMGDLEQIEETAYRILGEYGIIIRDEPLEQELKKRHFSFKGNRVILDKKLVKEFVDAERGKNGNQYVDTPQDALPESSTLFLNLSQYTRYYHDPQTNDVDLFTTDHLIHSMKLVDVLSEENIHVTPPGYPNDCHPDLQQVVQLWIALNYSSKGCQFFEPTSAKTFEHLLDMYEVFGKEKPVFPIWTISPLGIGGENMLPVLDHKDRLGSIRLKNFASVGGSAPINLGDAMAVSAAEVMGCALIAQAVTELPINWSIWICPVDFKTMAFSLGAPEDIFLQLAMAEVNSFLHGKRWSLPEGHFYTNAKLPGAQASAEKAAAMVSTALLGTRTYRIAGALSHDDIFSPEQFLYDIELRDAIQRMVEGMQGDLDPERCFRDVEEALEEGAFLGVSTTYDSFKSLYWEPKLYNRQFIEDWRRDRSTSEQNGINEQIKELVDKHRFELPMDQKREVDRILNIAKKTVGE